MKKIMIFILCFALVWGMTIPVRGEEQLLAKSAVLIDGENGRILYGKEPQQQMAMASTTKIMTCIVALEHADLQQVAEVSQNAVGMPKVRMNVRKGEQYYMKDLLYAMMLESYNDVAVVVAENVAGSVEEFANLMNQKAKEIGALHTNFVTPNGLDAQGHYSTAYDMALIGAYAIKNAQFVEIVKTVSHQFTDVSGKRSVSVTNKDAFLSMDKDALGIKTGFTGKAGYCFVGAVKSNGRTFVSCVLACGWPPNKTYKWHDTQILMKKGRDNFDYQTIFAEGKQVQLDITDGTKEQITAAVVGESRMLISDQDDIEVKTSFDYQLPIHAEDVLGKVEVYVNQECVESHEIVSLENVGRYDYRYCLQKTFDSLILQ